MEVKVPAEVVKTQLRLRLIVDGRAKADRFGVVLYPKVRVAPVKATLVTVTGAYVPMDPTGNSKLVNGVVVVPVRKTKPEPTPIILLVFEAPVCEAVALKTTPLPEAPVFRYPVVKVKTPLNVRRAPIVTMLPAPVLMVTLFTWVAVADHSAPVLRLSVSVGMP